MYTIYLLYKIYIFVFFTDVKFDQVDGGFLIEPWLMFIQLRSVTKTKSKHNRKGVTLIVVFTLFKFKSKVQRSSSCFVHVCLFVVGCITLSFWLMPVS